MDKKKTPWTKREEKYLRTNWGITSGDAIAKHIGKGVTSIWAKAHRLHLPSLHRRWNGKEKDFLASLYGYLPIEFIASSLSRSSSSCLDMIFKLQQDPNYAVSDKALQTSFKLHSDILKEKWGDPSYSKAMSEMAISLWQDPIYRNKLKNRINLLKIGDPEFLKKFYAGRHNRPTRPEKLLDILLQKHFPKEFVYNGDYSKGVSLGGLIPDFININGRKLVVEVFGDYWHSKRKGGLPWKATEFGRKAVFAQLGFDCVIIWESQLNNPESVIEEIRGHL